MRVLGLEISRAKAAVSAIAPAPGSGWNLFRVHEPFTGAWQRNISRDLGSVLTHSAVYSCVTLIASDIGKLRLKLVEQDADGIWTEVDNPAFSPVLRKPNRYQTRQKFLEQWLVSKLTHGAAYILKERDERNVVVAMYVLDPQRVKPLVAPDGSIYYQLGQDNLSGIEGVNTVVPASEIIHDVMVALYHPLCGVSPITACALPAAMGLAMQEHSAKFFANGASPGGVLTAPGLIAKETADRIKEQWQKNYGGDNVGKVAVLGDGLKYESMTVNSVDAQLIEQLRWTGETVASCYHVPAFMIGVGPAPPYANVQSQILQYYSQALQALIEAIEASLDEGLGLLKDGSRQRYGIEIDLDGLLRMDTATAMDVAAKAVSAGVYSPNDARKKFDMKPVVGGETPFLQQQNWPIRMLAERELPGETPAAPAPLPAPNDPPADDPDPDDGGEPDDDEKAAFAGTYLKGLLAA